MIELFINTSPEETLRQLKQTFKNPSEAYAELDYVIEHFINDDLRKPLIYEMGNAITAEGTVYQKVEFRITTRYISSNGDEYIAGDSFVVNFSEQHRELTSVVNTWEEERNAK